MSTELNEFTITSEPIPTTKYVPIQQQGPRIRLLTNMMDYMDTHQDIFDSGLYTESRSELEVLTTQLKNAATEVLQKSGEDRYRASTRLDGLMDLLAELPDGEARRELMAEYGITGDGSTLLMLWYENSERQHMWAFLRRELIREHIRQSGSDILAEALGTVTP